MPVGTGFVVDLGAPRCVRRVRVVCRAQKATKGFVVLGPPGSGKTHLCSVLAENFGLVHVAGSDLLEAHLKYKSPVGEAARKFVEAGEKIPNGIMVDVVVDRLDNHDCREQGFLLDGLPGNIEQEQALRDKGVEFVRIFMLHAPRNVLEKRLQYRRLDPEEKRIYNLMYIPPISTEITERLVELPEDQNGNVPTQLADYGQEVGALWERIGPKSIAINADRTPHDVAKEVALMIEASGAFPQFFPKSKRKEENGTAQNGANGAGIEDGVDGEENGTSAVLTDEAVPVKSPITLIRCDGYMCERESVESSDIKFRGAATEQVMLVWNRKPRNVLLLVKKSKEIMSAMMEAATYLSNELGLNVIVEKFAQTEALANGMYLNSFTNPDKLHQKVDLIVCLGGDGLILHASTLFKTAVPPLVSFNLGSLGFLTPFDFAQFGNEMEYVLEGSCLMSLRMRLDAKIVRSPENKSLPARTFQVLNEVVIDRGSSPYLSHLDCFCDEKFITTVQADGIIMSTPTGSTAYSMSAGGSMVHPSVPAILFTPICPHSLSFRPIVFPDAATLRVDVSTEARSHAWASFDGKFRQLLRRGDGVIVQMSLYPVPTINKTDHTGDWFGSLDRAFNFNNRPYQKPFSASKDSAL